MSLAGWMGIAHTGLAIVATVAAHVLLVVLAIGWLARRRRAAGWRSRCWIGALVATLLTVPVVTVLESTEATLVPVQVDASLLREVTPAPGFHPGTPGPAMTPAVKVERAPLMVAPSEAATSPAPTPVAVVHPSPARPPSSDGIFWALLALWGVGSFVAMTRRLRLRRLVQLLRTGCTPLDKPGLRDLLETRFPGRELPNLAASSAVTGAMTVGRGDPLILIPQDWLGRLSTGELADVLTHECAHVFHRDLRLGRFQDLARVLFWWHPAVALLNRELSIAREELCDDEVLRVSSAPSYARTLLSLSEQSGRPPVTTATGLSLLPRGWSMVDRVQGLIARDGIPPTSRRGGGWLALVLVGATALGSGVRLVNDPAPAVAAGDHRVEGVVVDAAGAPVGDAELLIAYETSLTVHGRTRADGSFVFVVRNEDPHFAARARVIARAHGHGAAWERLRGLSSGRVRLQLPAAGTIAGRIVSLEGEPVPGVRVQACELRESPGGDIDGWLAAIASDRRTTSGYRSSFTELVHARLPRVLPLGARDQALLSATTDADGRFRIRGAGEQRLVRLRMEGAGIATTDLMVVGSGIDSPMDVPEHLEAPGEGRVQLFGPRFEHHATPSRLVRGRVVDHETGGPVSGVTVRALGTAGTVTPSPATNAQWVTTVTDADGRFSLDGVAKGDGHQLHATPPATSPYVRETIALDNAEGVKPLDAELRLARGVAIIGQVRAKGTRRGIAARVSWSRGGGFFSPSISVRSPDDGYFKLTVPPGRGRLVATTKDGDRFTLVSERDDIPGAADISTWLTASVHGLLPVTVNGDGNEPFYIDVIPRPTRVVRVLDPEGRPLHDVAVCPTWSAWRRERVHEQLSFFNPKAEFLLLHDGRDLAGHFSASDRDLEELRLRPAASLTGRLVTTSGDPLPQARVRLRAEGAHGTFTRAALEADDSDTLRTDETGRFSVGGLAAGVPYTLELVVVDPVTGQLQSAQRLIEAVRFSPGEQRDLGLIRREDTP